MLQATLDPSSLLFINDQVETEAQIVVSLAGLSWAKGVPLPAAWNADQAMAKRFLYPWNWDLPTHLRVYWFKEAGGRYVSANEFIDLQIKLTDLSSYDADSKKLIEYYENILDERIFSASGINPDEVFFEFWPQKQHEIELNDQDPVPNQETKFYNASIADFSQKLSPLNELLKFIFFAPADSAVSLFKAPQGYAGFAVFPFNLTAGSRWEPVTVMPDTISCDKPTQAGDIPWVSIDYKISGADQMKVYCPVTPPTQKDQSQGPIKLRDQNGNFEGRVMLEVNDVEDQMPALLSVSGRFFDLPQLFFEFLKKHRNTYRYINRNEADYRKWILDINDFLWAVVRDAVGFGWRKETDKQSTADRIVRKYCDSRFGAVQSLNDEQQKQYWETYNQITTSLHKNLEAQWHADSSFDSNKWRNLQAAVFATDKAIKKYIDDAEAANKPVSARPLQLNSQIEPLTLQLTAIPPLPQGANLADFLNGSVDNWLHSWEKYLEHLYTDHLLQGRILFEQWFELNDKLQSIGLNLDTILEPSTNAIEKRIKHVMWYDELFSTIVDPRENQKEGIAVTYKDIVLRSLLQSLTVDIPVIARDWLNAVKQYANDRIDRNKSTFFPLLDQPPLGASPAAGFPDWNTFLASLDDNLNDAAIAAGNEIKRTFAIPPHLQIRVDKLEDAVALQLDDLNDEIAGHIVLMRRAQTMLQEDFLNNEWRYLNWARVNSVMIKGADRIVKELEHPYLLPAFLPEMEGNKISFLQLSNEKLSLVAGHDDSFNDSAYRNAGEEEWSRFEYKFDNSHRNYALWYGYRYEFAGFVALNSGVLPMPLRTGPAWNLPIKSPDLSAVNGKAIYPHLRRVPISRTRVEVRGRNDRPTAELPKELLPLAFELSDWKGNQNRDEMGAGASTDGQVHFLLAKGDRYDQEQIVLTLKKPTTSFWNWYAWLGPETETKTEEPFRNNRQRLISTDNALLDAELFVIDENDVRILDAAGHPVKGTVQKKSVAQLAMERDLQKRTSLNKGLTSDGLDLCDPAIANVAYIVIDKLFPEKIPGFKKYPVQLKKSASSATLHDMLAEFEQQLPVETIASGDTDVVRDANGFATLVKVKEGQVIRINVHSLFEKTALSKFHSWMEDVITNNLQTVTVPLASGPSECYLSKPVEIWVEAAKKLETDVAKIRDEEALLWKNMFTENDSEKVSVHLKKNRNNSETFAYLSRVEVRHQVWSWNGRLDESRGLVGNFYEEAERFADLAKDPQLVLSARQEALAKLIAIDRTVFENLTIENVGFDTGVQALRRYAEKNMLDPSPENPSTTEAMKWEAWAFSDRPDFSALVQETNLLAFRPNPEENAVQHLFSDRRPAEEKALYYRFALTAHSRYEYLGAPYNKPRESKLYISDPKLNEYTIWRRHLRKSTKAKQLPKPTVRFVIPLTKSIKECTDATGVGVAPLLIVLDDHWFSEAGLAEQFEMGIEVVTSPGESKGQYLSAGNDPILSKTSLGKFVKPTTSAAAYPYVEQKNGDNLVAVFEPKGPAGLTFDFAAQTPRLKGCAFIIEIPELESFIPVTSNKQTNKLQPWSLIQIAVRRGLRASMCKSGENIRSLSSEWSAREWVQFLPSVDSFIPPRWRKRVATEGQLTLASTQDGRVVSIVHQSQPDNELPIFDSLLEERMQRFLIVTEKVYDIGGQPCENFVAVYWYNDKQRSFELDPKESPYTRKIVYDGITEGYLRLLLVRNAEGDPKESIWQRLFGNHARKKQEMTAVQNDPTAALPIISERIPYKIS